MKVIKREVLQFLFLPMLILVLAFPNAGGVIRIITYYIMLISVFFTELQNKHFGRRLLVILWLLLFGGYVFLSQYWSVDVSTTQEVLNSVIWGLLICFSMTSMVYSGNMSLKEIYQYLIVVALFLVVNVVFNGQFSYQGRLSVGVNENIFGSIISGIVLFLIFRCKQQKWKNIFSILVFGLMTILGLLSGSRKAIVAIGMYFVMIQFFEYPEKSSLKKIKKYLFVLGIALFIMIALLNVPVLYNSIGNRIVTLFDFWKTGEALDGSAVTRANMNSMAIGYFMNHPFIGNGANSFKALSYYGTYAHNNYAEMLCNFGILGTCIYYIPVLIMLFKAFKQWRNKATYAVIPLAYFLSFIINGFAGVSYFNRVDYLFIGISVSIVYLIERGKNKK